MYFLSESTSKRGKATKVLRVTVGIDAEWELKDGRNFLLSWQWYGIAAGATWSGVHFPDGERSTLAQIVHAIIKAGLHSGALKTFPGAVVVIAHFALAEVSMLEDFEARKHQIDSIRRTFVSLQKPISVRIWDENRNLHVVQVTLRDSILLTPQGAGLKLLGHLHGVPKVELPPGEIEHMGDLLARDRELFTRYALTDAEIAARHGVYMAKMNERLCGELVVPISLGGLAAKFCLASWKRQEIDPLEVLGHEIVEVKIFEKATGRFHVKKNKVLKACLHHFETLAVESYHGGRNEAYTFGASAEATWLDWDLCAAYSTALATLGQPRWEEIAPTTNIDDFGSDVLGFAQLRFRFPGGIRYPCLPVRLDSNLLFPLSGETHATAPEIWLAKQLGAEIELLHGVVIPVDATRRPFEATIGEATALREASKKAGDVLGDKLYKELINSMYGKTGQGLRNKRVYDTRAGEHKVLPPSPLTSPFIAAYVTGLVRAVIAEIMNRLPAARTVISCTTDGFITDAWVEEIEAASRGPMSGVFREQRRRLTGDGTILEVKRRAAQVLCYRTRGQATLIGEPGSPPILAKAGLKPPRSIVEADVNDWLVGRFVGRTVDSTLTVEALRTLLMIFKDGGDLVSVSRTQRLLMDFDLKRCPTTPTERAIRGTPHLAFDSKPWKNVAEYEKVREQWARFRDASGRCLKSVDDLSAFNDFLAGAALNTVGLKRSTSGGTLKAAIRQVQRAFTASHCGLDSTTLSFRQFAEFMTAGGYKTTVDDIKNATRARFVPNSVPETAVVMKLMEHVKARFPNFDREQVLALTAAG